MQKQAELVFGEEKKTLALTGIDLAELCGDIFGRIGEVVKRVLQDSESSMEDINEVVLVGGSSRMPVVAFWLQAFLEKAPCVIGPPDEVVAMGAGLYAGIKERKEEIKDLVLTDICPFTLGTSVVNYMDTSRPIMSPVIERNSVLPNARTGFYTNAFDGQNHISVGVYQGESYYCDENIKLGDIEMDILPCRKGEAGFHICFTYDINGILEVEVTDLQQKKKYQQVFTTGSFRMSGEEMERRVRELQAYKLMPQGGIRTKLLLARGERLFTQFTGEKRRIVSEIMREIQAQAAGKDERQMTESLRKAEALFDELEQMER